VVTPPPGVFYAVSCNFDREVRATLPYLHAANLGMAGALLALSIYHLVSGGWPFKRAMRHALRNRLVGAALILLAVWPLVLGSTAR
jgi:hypothetical protein